MVSTRAAEFHSVILNAFYQHSSGIADIPDLQNIYNRYTDIFSADSLHEIRHLSSSDEVINRRLRYLIEFLLVEYVNRSAIADKQKLLELKSQKLQFLVGRFSYNELKQKLFWAYGKEKQQIEEEIEEFAENKLNGLLMQTFQAELRAINEFGFKDHLEMFQSITGIDPGVWRDSASRFLDDTSDVYFRELSEYKLQYFNSNDIDISRDDLYRSFWEVSNDDCFRAISPLEIFNRLIGYKSNRICSDRIKIESSGVTGRAFCSVLSIPDDIRLVIGVGGGFHNIRDLLHESGHALHYSAAEDSLPFEYLRLGDDSVTESYAALFENLVYEASWLESELLIDKIQKSELISFLKFYKLTKLRSIALKAVYDIDFFSGHPAESLKADFVLHHKKHLGVEVNEYGYLAETEPFLFSLRYFRAQMLAFNLRCKLETSFGIKWFENKEAFKELNRLWKKGQQYSPEEISDTFYAKELLETDLSSEFN